VLSFDYRVLAAWSWHGLSSTTEVLLFLGFLAAFAIKVPLVPFHTWLPDVHTEAPTAGSVVLAGVILKMGAYGLLRFSLELFPHASVDLAPLLLTLGVIGILYGAIVAAMQKNLKRIIAYSSVAHMGFVIVGIFSLTLIGLDGAVFTMLSHPLTTGALFLLVGILYERRHTFEIEEFGDLSYRPSANMVMEQMRFGKPLAEFDRQRKVGNDVFLAQANDQGRPLIRARAMRLHDVADRQLVQDRGMKIDRERNIDAVLGKHDAVFSASAKASSDNLVTLASGASAMNAPGSRMPCCGWRARA